MVKVRIGDMFESEAQTLVNTVNCVGVMGKGIALEFKKRFPDMFRDYAARCARGEVKLGRPYLYRRILPPWILNFPTKDHWRSVGKLADIEEGMEYLLAQYGEWGITSLAVPPLACGQGQLEWRVVGPTLYRCLNQMDIPVELYAPFGTSHKELRPDFLKGKRASARARMPEPAPPRVGAAYVALVEILRRLQEQPYHWPVGRTIFQKLAYVATEAGLPTGLKHTKGSFGPFARGFKGEITKLVNNGLIEEERHGRMFVVKVGRTLGDAKREYDRQLQQWGPIINGTFDLFMRLNTRQSELVATVLFAAKSLAEARGQRPTEQDVLDEVMEWKSRKRRPFMTEEVALAIRSLAALGWIDLEASTKLPLPEESLSDV